MLPLFLGIWDAKNPVQSDKVVNSPNFIAGTASASTRLLVKVSEEFGPALTSTCGDIRPRRLFDGAHSRGRSQTAASPL